MHSVAVLRAFVLLMNYHKMAEKFMAVYIYINNHHTRLTR